MRKVIFFCFYFSTLVSSAQTTNDFAESFYFFPKNTWLLIPSYSGIGNDGQLTAGYKSYIGPLAAIRAYTANVSYNIQKGKNEFPLHTKHILGAGFYSEKEGEFFDRSRVFLHYAWHKTLSNRWTLSAGAAVHVINYTFKSSSAGSNGSAFTWSGNIGASVYTSTFKLGISVNDFNRPQIRPVDYTFILYRYTTFHIEKSVSIGPTVVLTASGRGNWVAEGYSTGMAHMGITLSENVGIHGFMHTTQGWGAAFDLPHIPIGDTWLDVSFAYKLPYPNSTKPPYSLYEINVGYYFFKKGEINKEEVE